MIFASIGTLLDATERAIIWPVLTISCHSYDDVWTLNHIPAEHTQAALTHNHKCATVHVVPIPITARIVGAYQMNGHNG